MSKQQVKVKRGFSFGTFFFGIFMGLLLTVGAIVGVGFFAYNKLSVQWINNTFNANVNLGNEDLNNKTIKDFVNSANYMVNNLDTYTLNNLKTDFGVQIGDELMGLNIEDLKDVPLNDLSAKIQEKLGSISAYEIRDLMDLSSMESILGKYNTYYYNSIDNKIYKDEAFTQSVDFDYSVSGSVITIKGQTFNIQEGKVDVQLKYIPLAVAIGDFTSTMGDRITLGELESNYGVTLPSYFNGLDRQTTINELETEINKLQLANFLGYEFDTATQKYYNDKDNDKVLDAGEELSGVVNAIAYTTVSGIPAKLNNLTIQDLFSEQDLSSGVLSLIDATKTVDQIPNEINKVVQNTKLGTLVENNIITINGYNADKELNIGGVNIKISQLTVPQIIEAVMAS